MIRKKKGIHVLSPRHIRWSSYVHIRRFMPIKAHARGRKQSPKCRANKKFISWLTIYSLRSRLSEWHKDYCKSVTDLFHIYSLVLVYLQIQGFLRKKDFDLFWRYDEYTCHGFFIINYDVDNLWIRTTT